MPASETWVQEAKFKKYCRSIPIPDVAYRESEKRSCEGLELCQADNNSIHIKHDNSAVVLVACRRRALYSQDARKRGGSNSGHGADGSTGCSCRKHDFPGYEITSQNASRFRPYAHALRRRCDGAVRLVYGSQPSAGYSIFHLRRRTGFWQAARNCMEQGYWLVFHGLRMLWDGVLLGADPAGPVPSTLMICRCSRETGLSPTSIRISAPRGGRRRSCRQHRLCRHDPKPSGPLLNV